MKSIIFAKVYAVFGCVLLVSLMSLQVNAQANFVMGTSTASGSNSFAAGDSSMAIGNTTLAMGNKARAEGDFSLSLGDRTLSTGRWSQAFGFGSIAAGDYSLGAGFFNYVPGAFGVGIGAANIVTGAGGLAIGRDNQSYGDAGAVIGARSISRTYGEIVLGAYAEDYTPTATSGFEWQPTDRLFVIGNGFGDGAGNGDYRNALTMLKNGDTDMVGNLNLDKTIKVGEDVASVNYEEGQIRYNSASQDLEGYTQSSWRSLTGSSKLSLVPKIGVSENTNNLKSAVESADAFIKFEGDGLEGESTDAVHMNETDVLDFSWSMANNGNVQLSPPPQVSPRFSDLSILIAAVRPLEKLTEHLASGKHITKATLVIRKSGNHPIEFMTFIIEDIIVTAVNWGVESGSDGIPLARVSLNFAKFGTQFIVQQPDGGGPGATPDFGWDIGVTHESR